MADFAAALGLMFVIEGASWALFPDGMRGMMARASALPTGTLRSFGLFFAVFGFIIVAVIRGY